MRPVVKQIVRQVLPHFGYEETEPEDITTGGRAKSRVEARMACIWVTRRVLGLSYPELGREFKKDHTTCFNACHRIERFAAQEGSAVGIQARAALASVMESRGPSVGQAKPIELDHAWRGAAAE